MGDRIDYLAQEHADTLDADSPMEKALQEHMDKAADILIDLEGRNSALYRYLVDMQRDALAGFRLFTTTELSDMPKIADSHRRIRRFTDLCDWIIGTAQQADVIEANGKA